MKKVVLNLSDSAYEKFRFEAIEQKKDVPEILFDRIFHKEFSPEVLLAFDKFMDQELEKIVSGA